MLPASWKKIPITGRFVGRDGVPVVGTISFDSPQSVEVAGQLVVPRVISFVLDEDGNIPHGAELPSTHDPDLSVTGWPYTVHERWSRGRKPYQIFVPYDAVSLNIPDLSPLVAPPVLAEIARGPRGKSAYATAVDEGFSGTPEEWLASLRGEDGAPGPQGPPGQDGNAISPVLAVTVTSRAVTLADSGSYLRFTALGSKTASFATGQITGVTEVHIANRASSGNLTLSPAVGVQLAPPANGTLVLAPGHSVTIKGVAANEADVIGATVPA